MKKWVGKNNFAGLLVAAVFFLVGLVTLSDYGINWDSPNHFNRGQAYLNYILTGGRKDYGNLEGEKKSIYHDNSESAAYYLNKDSAHPPLNGIMAAVFNLIFYQKLGIAGDIESYHLFILTTSAFLVFVVAAFATEVFGVFAGLVAGLVMATYPLFWGEAHFNIKDPVETAFFAATIYYFWKSVKQFDWKELLVSAVFFGLAFGTKFNVLFVPVIIVPWLIIHFSKELKKPLDFIKKIPGRYKVMMMLYPLVVLIIFFACWPFLWQNPIGHFKEAFSYYYEIGTGGRGQTNYILPGGLNLFPGAWVLFTTPPLVLALTGIGVVGLLRRWRKRNKVGILWLVWMILPIARVTLPNASIYGGSRQIMEFIPGMALMAGMGAYYVTDKIKGKAIKALILVLFVPMIVVLVRLHPNENVYFNCLIGGLMGAQKYNIPYWGNSYGNAYKQAVEWLNDNVNEPSRLAMVQSVERSMPRLYLSEKIIFSNTYWSGFDRRGEYLMELTHNNNKFAYPWVWDYVERVLVPVYEVEADGVAIAKVWKNDAEHSREEYKSEIELPIARVLTERAVIKIELEEVGYVARVVVNFKDQGDGCRALGFGVVQTSPDGEDWLEEEDRIGANQVSGYSTLEGGRINFMLPAREVKTIKLFADYPDSCLFVNPKITVQGFKKN